MVDTLSEQLLKRLSGAGRLVFEFATAEAHSLGSDRVETEHILLGLACTEESTAARALAEHGLDHESILAGVRKSFTTRAPTPLSELPLSDETEHMLAASFVLARNRGQTNFGPNDILLGLVQEGVGRAAEVTSEANDVRQVGLQRAWAIVT